MFFEMIPKISIAKAHNILYEQFLSLFWYATGQRAVQVLSIQALV
jgi:hypothetical protein